MVQRYNGLQYLAYRARQAARQFAPAYMQGFASSRAQQYRYNQAANAHASRRNYSNSDNAPVTSQYDVKTWYKKKNMPRNKKKKWKKFSNKVKAVFNKQIAPTIFLYRTVASINASADQQAWASVMLFTADGAAPPNEDLQRISVGLKGSGGNQIASKFRFESGCLDLLMRNPGSVSMLVDIYTIYCRKDVPDNYTSPVNLLTSLDNNASADANADAIIADTDIGFVPFSSPLFCSFFKVSKKRTLTLGAGSVSEIQLRDAKNRKLWGIDYVGKPCMRGWTKGYLLCIRGAYNGTTTPAVQLDIAYTRHYVLRQIQDSTLTTAKV